ncbi:ubiquitin-related modifier 1-like isoform X1 [Myxocyprinus asiaticus]|uniref:ubiquitin-related modifier 1-like isoform X1 n=1 Tax=Myxocyprinus asiaticus TaxID=70543 RepID=UPI0022230CC1|nr:ubiquitin-related modifier 1-like isoform X1 [Myxocyprinus asiaticus]
MAAPLALHLEFGGGAELLFDGVKNHHVTLPGQSDPWDMKQLLVWIRGNMLKERPELFMQGDTVRPGILVLINDADWELMVSVCVHPQSLPPLSVLMTCSFLVQCQLLSIHLMYITVVLGCSFRKTCIGIST